MEQNFDIDDMEKTPSVYVEDIVDDTGEVDDNEEDNPVKEGEDVEKFDEISSPKVEEKRVTFDNDVICEK